MFPILRTAFFDTESPTVITLGDVFEATLGDVLEATLGDVLEATLGDELEATLGDELEDTRGAVLGDDVESGFGLGRAAGKHKGYIIFLETISL